MTLIKVTRCRFEQCLFTFTMPLLKGSSETGPLRHLSNHVFGVRNFGNRKSMKVIFFFKTSKISDRFQKWTKNWEKVFCFWDNCIWIVIVNLFLWTTRYISSAANVLRSSPKIWHVNKRNFSNCTNLEVINDYDKGSVMQILLVLGHFYHLPCRRVF